MLLNYSMDLSELNLTNHCIQRMKERRVSCETLFHAIRVGSLVVEDDKHHYFLNDLKVVVDMKNKEIVTCFRGKQTDSSLMFNKDELFQKIPKKNDKYRITRRNRKKFFK